VTSLVGPEKVFEVWDKVLRAAVSSSHALRVGSSSRLMLRFPSILDHSTSGNPRWVHRAHLFDYAGSNMTRRVEQAEGQVFGTVRLRGVLAGQFSRQLAEVVSSMHLADVVHGRA